MHRRDFIRGGVILATGGAMGARPSARSYGRVAGANDRVNVAVIGAGGRGWRNLASISGREEQEFAGGRVTGTNIVALCDVDLRREGPRQPGAARAFDEFGDAAKHHDYRKMLDELDREIDAVLISTPNHHHAPASIMAMRRGKHVYCEKPGAHSVSEARAMSRVAAEQGVATQLGTQVHSSENYRRIVELIRHGAIGEVSSCHLWLRSGWPVTDRPAETPPVPPDLRWDLWLGPAPERPYHPSYIPTRWHQWWDFGGGMLGNMGCHYTDLVFWAMGLEAPSTIESEGPRPSHPESAPDWQHVRYTFDRGPDRSPFALTWTHGPEPQGELAEHHLPEWAWGVFVGSEGRLLVSYPRHELLPEGRFADFRRPDPSIPPSVGHHQEWIDACRGEGQPSCHFGYSMRVTEAVLLGNVAYRSGRMLRWDASRLAIEDAPEAESLLRRDYRAGWM
jgi:predicted dehydrogenase